MNGFFVSITNNLLEDKHFEKMGNSVWLYMWLIDKMTDISEGQGITNHGNPITVEMVQRNFGTMSERTYYRMIDTLRKADYINTVKAKYGLYITINKAKKQFNKRVSSPAKNVETEQSSPAKSGNSKTSRLAKSGNGDLPNMADRLAKSGKTLYIRNYNTITNTKLHSTKVLGSNEPVVYGKPEINSLFNYWQEQVGYEIQAKLWANRQACNNLFKKHGDEKLRQLILGVALTQQDQFAPRISDFCELQAKLNSLVMWGRKRQQEVQSQENVRI